MAKFGHNLPAVLVPDGEICVNVKIPNHPDYVSLFLRAVRMLETQRLYARDETMQGAKIVAEQWRDRTITPLIEALATGLGCPEDVNEFDCIEYPAYSSFVEYVPDNPYDPNAPIPNNYLTHAWWRWGRLETVFPDWVDNPLNFLIEEFTQYQENDALTWLGSLPLNGLGELIDNNFPFPYIKIHVSGEGTARMNFLSFPVGGRIFVEVDEIPNIIDILTSSFIDPDSRVIDTDRDIETFPMEQYPVISVKVDVVGGGDHIIYCMLMPRIAVGLDFFGFGGGLRSVELCNGLRPINTPPLEPPPPLEGVEELRPEFQFTTDCGMEYRLRDQDNNIVQDWTAVAGWVDNAALCFGGGEVATVEEICEGVICAMEKSASRFLSGVVGNVEGGITINPDGTIEVGGADGVPGDDPNTEWDESAAAYLGGAIALRQGIRLFYDKLDTYYGPVNGTPINAEPYTKFQINNYFQTNEASMDLAIDEYYLYRATNNRHVFTPTSAFDFYLQCKGANELGFTRWILEVSGYPIAKQENMLLLIAAMADEFWTDYFNLGVKVPSLDYIQASCYPTQDEAWQYDMSTANDVAYTLTYAMKPGHRYLFQASGSFVDSDVPNVIKDAFWTWDTSTGIKTFENMTWAIGGITAPTSAKIPFDPSHNYKFTIDKDNNGSTNGGSITKTNGSFTLPNVTGIIQMSVHDEGEYAL